MDNEFFLAEVESDMKILEEVKALLEFAPPKMLRKSIEELFDCYMENHDEFNIQEKERIFASHIYALINFLSAVESK